MWGLINYGRQWQILKEKILTEMSEMNLSEIHYSSQVIPSVGWALANIVCLAMGVGNDSADLGSFNQGLDCASYAHVVITLAENLLGWIENVGWVRKEKQDVQSDVSVEPIDRSLCETETTHGSLKMSYIDLLRPVCQQWHLTNLLAIMKTDSYTHGAETTPPNNIECLGKFELLDIAYFYSYMLRIFSVLNPTLGSLPVLNMLSFTPGFLVSLWGALEGILFPGNGHVAENNHLCISENSKKEKDGVFVKKQKGATKDGVNKWVSVLNKVTGKSQAGVDLTDGHPGTSQVDEDSCDVWYIEHLRCGPQGISKDMTCLLHLFCSTYSHLLLILDDIEFYEKQVYIYIYFLVGSVEVLSDSNFSIL
jgi:ubiquitin-protein ligase E3 B